MKRYAIIPTGNRQQDYLNVYLQCKENNIIPVTIATSALAVAYSQGKVIRENEVNISKWWNLGLNWIAEKQFDSDEDYVVYILNDDIELPRGWFDTLQYEIIRGNSGASGERTGSPEKIAGYAFALNGKHDMRFDENLHWYYGDDDIQHQCESEGGFSIVKNLKVINKYARSSEKALLEQIEKDKEYYQEKYKLDVTVIVATCGTDEWRLMGNEAQNSIPLDVRSIRVHEPLMTVSEARNYALTKVETEYVCFLDADDSLGLNYFKGVASVSDVIVTSISYNKARPTIPKVPEHLTAEYYHRGPCKAECLLDGNYLHVGSIVKTEAVRKVGGFPEYPVYEDWALWLKMQQNGATFSNHPESVYYASVRESPGHRNSSLPRAERNKVHQQIVKDIVK